MTTEEENIADITLMLKCLECVQQYGDRARMMLPQPRPDLTEDSSQHVKNQDIETVLVLDVLRREIVQLVRDFENLQQKHTRLLRCADNAIRATPPTEASKQRNLYAGLDCEVFTQIQWVRSRERNKHLKIP